MKTTLLLLFFLLLSLCSHAQTTDSIGAVPHRSNVFGASGANTSAKSLRSSGWWQIVSKENVSIKTSNFRLSEVEDGITNLESEECGALKNRDTTTLIRIWARDFSQDVKQNKIVDTKNGLPNYLYLQRMVESITAIDSNTVYTSGYETFREIKTTEKLETEGTRKYFHIWTRRRNGMWKLTTKRFD